MKFKILIFVLFLIAGCNSSDNEIEKIPLAKVHDNYLYDVDIKGLFASNISKAVEIL